MRYAVMSDVHANPQALERALADARAQGCETGHSLLQWTTFCQISPP